jgi:hypothetical protein
MRDETLCQTLQPAARMETPGFAAVIVCVAASEVLWAMDLSPLHRR